MGNIYGLSRDDIPHGYRMEISWDKEREGYLMKLIPNTEGFEVETFFTYPLHAGDKLRLLREDLACKNFEAQVKKNKYVLKAREGRGW